MEQLSVECEGGLFEGDHLKQIKICGYWGTIYWNTYAATDIWK